MTTDAGSKACFAEFKWFLNAEGVTFAQSRGGAP
eukprot:CAMPEP_0184677640 /NCGR_PEP_ID=MMETSP0312-20130426/215_1 /TAXON_ID=31354 /ORGANISM="Compsopogon coeruleus, Strain SAG 36.94" /LENGTH=33 /DNA_ID= /DNA_START= /DNA_END= /DNA_ORIENTATION=